ncbi:hypothetical protein VPH35_049351 [Triticum aestivum]|uniref:3B chromosome, clone BAC TA3B63C11, 2 unordered pieces n=1 Tax=Triticum aestivum TaxID=4565 RepID=B4ERX6_WHEAT|nr:unnamed protein product [Triticum aestivum]
MREGAVAIAPRLLQHGSGSLASLIWAWACSCSTSGLQPLEPVEVVPSHVAAVLPAPVNDGFVWPGRPRDVCRGETMMVSSWLWWRMLVGGRQDGVNNWSSAVGVRGREKSLSGMADSDVMTPVGATTLLEGRRVYLSLTPLRAPGEILGLVRAATSSSSRSFLKVLLDTRQFDGIGMRQNSSVGAVVARFYSFR